MKTFISDLSKKEFPVTDRVTGKTVRPSVMAIIQEEHPDFTEDNVLAASELNQYREKYIARFLPQQQKDLTDLEKTVLRSMAENSLLSEKIKAEEVQPLTAGQKVADKVASFGGSWTFILLFIGFLLIWIAINAFYLLNRGFDPYPFILLNLILSCVAALQAPVIMMSQNRQEEKDRERAQSDYMVNLKSELEIRILNEKLDHLLKHQEEAFLEIQKVQVEMLQDILNRLEKKRPVTD